MSEFSPRAASQSPTKFAGESAVEEKKEASDTMKI
jgi:hypothetical protein